MKKIIVPTDFSKAASNAYAYAKAIADFTHMPLKVVHITHPGNSIDTNSSQIISDLIDAKKEKLNEFVCQFDQQDKAGVVSATTLVKQEVIVGFPVDEIIKLSEAEDCDFIIMGTTGARGLLRKFLGSVSSSVSKKAKCPVWLIPPNTNFEGIENILYAGNYESANSKMLNEIVTISDVFDAIIHLVHVNLPKNGIEEWKFEKILLSKMFKDKMPKGFPIDLNTVNSDSFWEGINEYVDNKQINLVVMVTRHRSFWEGLLHQSMTESMIVHSKVPLLIMHLEDEI